MRHAVIISVHHGTCWYGGYFHIERINPICFCFFFNKWWCGKKIMIVIMLYDRPCVLRWRVEYKTGYETQCENLLFTKYDYQLTIFSSSIVLRPDLSNLLGEQLDGKIYRTLFVTERLYTSWLTLRQTSRHFSMTLSTTTSQSPILIWFWSSCKSILRKHTGV